MELSIVIPCLNESETLQICIDKIKNQLTNHNIHGEIIIADNGSTDGSIEIAKKNNVKIVNVESKGYGNALRTGIDQASGKYVLVADGDDSYDFNDLLKFYNKILQGYDLVQGCRLPSGGGKIKKGAMPFTHRYIGNPFFSFLAKILFKLNVNDIYCGMKIFKKETYDKIFFYSSGMVFCLEILIKFNQFRLNIGELPITLYKDGRIKGKSHLKTLTDGLKTLKFIIIFSPKWVFFIPGIILFLIGFLKLIYDSFYYNLDQIKHLSLDILSIYLGIQLVMLGFYSSIRSENLGFTENKKLKKFFEVFSLKRSLIFSLLGITISIFFLYSDVINFISEDNKFILSLLSIFVFLNLLFSSFFVALLKENN